MNYTYMKYICLYVYELSHPDICSKKLFKNNCRKQFFKLTIVRRQKPTFKRLGIG